METVVNEFPPPPSYYKEFVSEDSFPLPPEIPSIVETYGGSLPIQPIDNEDQTTSHLLPKQLKQLVNELIQLTLHFAADSNRREPIERGVADMEILVTRIHEVLQKYRIHEARENVCVLLRKELKELIESRNHLERTYDQMKASFEES